MRDEISLEESSTLDAPPSASAETRFDRLVPWIIATVFLGSGIALWATNGASVFASAISGLWALCF